MGMKRLAAVLLPLALGLLALACGEANDGQTPLPPAMEATVQAVVAETQTANATVVESDVEGTITARVQATVQALLAATPIPSPTPTGMIPTPTTRPTIFTTITGGAFNTSPAPTRTPSPTATLTATPRPPQLAPCSPAADGTQITAWVNGIQAASAPVSSGSYILLVEQAAGASFTGQMISFKVGDSPAGQTVRWIQGGATELVLSAPGEGLSRLNPGSLAGGPLAQPLPPHVVLGTVFIGDC